MADVESYKVVKDFEGNGFRVSKGVIMRNTFIDSGSDCVSVVGSSVFVNIPKNCLEKIEEKKFEKKIRKKKKESVVQSSSARISSRPDLLKKE